LEDRGGNLLDDIRWMFGASGGRDAGFMPAADWQ
jgi:hypothetical protein